MRSVLLTKMGIIKKVKPYDEIGNHIEACKLIIEDVTNKKVVKEIRIEDNVIDLEFDNKIFFIIDISIKKRIKS